MGNRWVFTGVSKVFQGRIVKQVRFVKRPEGCQIGGWVEQECNLSQEDDSYIGINVVVLDDARVSESAMILDRAVISGQASVYGNSYVGGTAKIKGKALVYDNAKVLEYGKVEDYAKLSGNCVVTQHATVKGRVCLGGQASIGGTSCMDGRYSLDEPVWIERGIWRDKPTVLSLQCGLIYECKPNVINVCGHRFRLRVFNTPAKRNNSLNQILQGSKDIKSIMAYVNVMVESIRQRNLVNPVEVVLKSCRRPEIYHPDPSIRYVEPCEDEIVETVGSLRDSNNFYSYSNELIEQPIECIRVHRARVQEDIVPEPVFDLPNDERTSLTPINNTGGNSF